MGLFFFFGAWGCCGWGEWMDWGVGVVGGVGVCLGVGDVEVLG